LFSIIADPFLSVMLPAQDGVIDILVESRPATRTILFGRNVTSCCLNVILKEWFRTPPFWSVVPTGSHQDGVLFAIMVESLRNGRTGTRKKSCLTQRHVMSQRQSDGADS
jgi:hypothetical protein